MSDYDIQVEYEVATSSEEENVFSDGSSSGNDVSIIILLLVYKTYFHIRKFYLKSACLISKG